MRVSEGEEGRGVHHMRRKKKDFEINALHSKYYVLMYNFVPVEQIYLHMSKFPIFTWKCAANKCTS